MYITCFDVVCVIRILECNIYKTKLIFGTKKGSVADPYVFGPSGAGAGSASQRYGSGSGSFYHQAKLVRKTLIPTVL